MKRLFFCLLFLTGALPLFANPMLQNPVTGSLNNLRFLKLCIASNGTDAVLLTTDNTSIYAIDIADNDPGEAMANTITSIPDFVASKLVPVAGQTVFVTDMVVNPVSKTVYIVAWDNNATASFIFKVKNNGASVTLLDLSNIRHSKISWPGTANIMDMAWGNGTLYVSSGMGLSSLDGELGWIKAPFAHNSTVTRRATTMFKTNWGNTYVTDAPLETIAYADIAGKSRLMGVTTCAPGFSLDVSGLSSGGLLQVTEDFNVNSGMSYKVVFQRHDGVNWLFDLHEGGMGGKLYRIGEKYIDGSQVTAGKYNTNSVELRDMSMNRTAGLTDADLKLYPGSYTAIAFWDSYRLLVLESGNGALKMMQTAVTAPPLNIATTFPKVNSVMIYPNPSPGVITIALPAGTEKGLATIFDVGGKTIWSKYVEGPDYVLDMGEIGKGNYTLSLTAVDGSMQSAKFTIK